MDPVTEVTRAVIDRVYEAYLAGSAEGMLAEMADDAVVTFPGHGTFRVDGEHAAVPWDETARTKRGEPWEAIGCDVWRVVDGQIVELTCIGDTDKTRRLLDPWPPAE
jgi:ketosteroid isomerase-like protein